jgi:hypothetical protein
MIVKYLYIYGTREINRHYYARETCKHSPSTKSILSAEAKEKNGKEGFVAVNLMKRIFLHKARK